jgi:hypothetical protein
MITITKVVNGVEQDILLSDAQRAGRSGIAAELI